ncbi:MAG: hypothetical protein ABI395_12100 [Sphingobium sp.]
MTEKTDTPPVETPTLPQTEAKDETTSPPASGGGKPGLWVGAAVGIGSAAIVAALLYSNRGKK